MRAAAERRAREPRLAHQRARHQMIVRHPEVRAMRMSDRVAKFRLGQVVRHRMFPFRGVIFDVDPEFSNTEEWYQAIPEEIRPAKNQPFYHLLAENEDAYYVAYVSEQNLVVDDSGDPVEHPQIGEVFAELKDGIYVGRKIDRMH
jgi:heat shock protein HspQ